MSYTMNIIEVALHLHICQQGGMSAVALSPALSIPNRRCKYLKKKKYETLTLDQITNRTYENIDYYYYLQYMQVRSI
jgi:hypothetical protein